MTEYADKLGSTTIEDLSWPDRIREIQDEKMNSNRQPAWTEEKAKKYDHGKMRMELIPPEAIEELAKVLTFGAKKYEDRNWEAGMDWGRVYGALQRHLTSWWGGEDKDKETGESHLSHALCCLAFLTTYERRNVGEDTRVKS